MDEELDALLFDDKYKGIRNLWNEFNLPLYELIWQWFLWSYSRIYPGGIFDLNNKMKQEAEEEYNKWIEKNLSKIESVFKGD